MKLKCKYCDKYYQTVHQCDKCPQCACEFQRILNKTMNKVTECVIAMGGKDVTEDK